MQIDTDELIRLATRLAAPGQLPGASCCMFVIFIAATIEAVTIDGELTHIFNYGCGVTFCIGLFGLAFPILRLPFSR